MNSYWKEWKDFQKRYSRYAIEMKLMLGSQLLWPELKYAIFQKVPRPYRYRMLLQSLRQVSAQRDHGAFLRHRERIRQRQGSKLRYSSQDIENFEDWRDYVRSQETYGKLRMQRREDWETM